VAGEVAGDVRLEKVKFCADFVPWKQDRLPQEATWRTSQNKAGHSNDWKILVVR
jgi:hypothetical protein